MKVRHAQLEATAVGRTGWPSAPRPEIAFAGRSNVGKSSLINALVGTRALMRVSGTPGRTRALHFVDVALAGAPVAALRLVDLPGYGYAKVAKTERRRWGPMVEGYVQDRACLTLVVVVVDARRPPTELDRAMVAWLGGLDRPLHVAVTKLDKLPKTRREGAVATAARTLELPRARCLGVSSVEALGRDPLWRVILEHARGAD